MRTCMVVTLLAVLAAASSAASDMDIRKGGSLWARVESDGTIRVDGSIWGAAESCCTDFRSRRVVAAVLTFFTDEF